jgi:glycosyltransferase involved in cell wall biosynthesis
MQDLPPITIGVMMRHIAAPGGITVYTRNILEHLLRVDTRNRYVLFYPEDTLMGAYADRPKVTEVWVPSRRGLCDRMVWDQCRLLKHLSRHAVDVVFNPKLSVPLAAGCPTVFTMHGLEQFAARRMFPWNDRIYFTLAMRLYSRRADGILVMTQTGRRDLRKYLGVPDRKIHVISESYNESYHVVRDQAERDRVRTRLGLPERYVLFVGGIAPLKNLPALLRAFRDLRGQGFPHKLVLAGFKRFRFERDLALIDELGLRPDAIELGFVDDRDMAGLYTMADAFVLPSFYEGFGIPILEAQACGCPVVVGNRGAMIEVAGEGGALSFDPHSASELARTIATALTDEALRRSLIERGLDNVKRYSWDRTARQTVSLFESLAARRPRSPMGPING